MKTHSGLFIFSLALALAGCGADESAPGTESTGSGMNGSPSASESCATLINGYRESIKLPPYERWTEGESCASQEAQSDAASQIPHGAFGQCNEAAQNECPGWPGKPEDMITGCLQMMWDEGPGQDFSKHGHYLNMSSTQFTAVACGFHTTASGEVWSVQNFK